MNVTIHHGIFGGEVAAPPSKSYTHRAIIMGFLAKGTSELINPLISSDIKRTCHAVTSLGARFDAHTIHGGVFTLPDHTIQCGGSGTTLRLMTGVACLVDGAVQFSGNESLRKRPIKDLLNALKELGAKIKSKKGFLPIITYGGLRGGKTAVNCSKSSQFLSSLLIALPLAAKNSEVVARNVRSTPYVKITTDMLKTFNIEFEKRKNIYRIPANQEYRPVKYKIPGDFSSAAYFLAAAAITNKKITVKNVDLTTYQGDKKIVEILKEMGAHILCSKKAITVYGGNLKGITIDCSDIPDLLPVLCVLGGVSKGKTVLYNAHHVRYKESDRIHNMAVEMRKLGFLIKEYDDGLIIHHGTIKKNTVLNSHNDHRICMALSIAALKSENITIKNVECVSESYPNFFDDLESIGGILK